MPPKNLQLLKGTLIMFEVLQLLWEHVLQYVDNIAWKKTVTVEVTMLEADDDDSVDKEWSWFFYVILSDLLISKLILKCILKRVMFIFFTGL